MDLRAQLDRYEVTAVPLRRGPLTLVWSVLVSDDIIDLTDSLEGADGALPLLDDYRITRVPSRAAS